MNIWTETMLNQDIHAGNPLEAALIREENNLRGHEICGNCGGEAHYKHTVGTHKCTKCFALKFRQRTPSGTSVTVWDR